MKLALPRAEVALGGSAALVGAISIVSALTPSLRSRSEVVQWLLPSWAPDIATVAALVLGLVLLRLAAPLARGRRSAWQLAVAMTGAAAVAHVVKGLDVEEATVSVLLLAALVGYRTRFTAPAGAPAKKLVPTVAACVALAAFALRLPLADPLEDALAGLALVLAVRALFLWVCPLGQVVRQTAEERTQAARLVDAHGCDSLAFFSLRHDKCWFFADDGRAFLSYRVIGGIALISGDPIGEPDAVERLLHTFTTHAHARGWHVAVAAAGEGMLPLYASLGLRAFPLGREAVLRPCEFTLEGRAVRKVRQSVHRARRAGYAVRVLDAACADADTRAKVSRLAAEARGAWPERGFSMALDDLFAPETILALAEDARGRLGAMMHLVPSRGGYSLSSMRRVRGTVNGLMEFLIAETSAWAAARGVDEISLNFCVFADLLAAERPPRVLRAVRWALLRFDAVFQLERLRSFSAKFRPLWRPRYVLYERVSDMPLVGLAYLRVESLLTPPGPWAHTTR